MNIRIGLFLMAILLFNDDLYAQTKVLSKKVSKDKVLAIDKKVAAIQAKRSYKSKGKNVTYNDSKKNVSYKGVNDFYFDSASKRIDLIIQRINVYESEMNYYYFEKGTLIKIIRYRLKEKNYLITIGEYWFEKNQIIKKVELNGDEIAEDNLLKVARQLFIEGNKLINKV